MLKTLSFVKAISFAVITMAIFTSCSTVKPSASHIEAARKLKNAPIPSAGRGKALVEFQTGIHTNTITSAGLTRQYIIDIPANYDRKKPYRSDFCHAHDGREHDRDGEEQILRAQDLCGKG